MNETKTNGATARLTSWQHVSERNGETANLSTLTPDGRLGELIARDIPRKLATEIRDAVNERAALLAVAEAARRIAYQPALILAGLQSPLDPFKALKDALAKLREVQGVS